MSEPAHDADLSIAESHGGHIKGRPVSWTVVVMVSGGFLVAGIGLATATPWLFIAGLAVVLLGGILGWATHAMADVTARVERKAARATQRQRAVAGSTAMATAEPDGSQTSVRG
jgi:hypothetical protein